MSGEERRLVPVQVFEGNEWGDDWPAVEKNDDTLLVEVIQWFQAKLVAIPEEYRDTAKCEVGHEDVGYECTCGHIHIWYERPETDEEYERRTAEDARRKERVRELRERTAYTRDMRGEATLIVRGLGPGLEAMRKRGLTE